jgi:WD40 repeat protein
MGIVGCVFTLLFLVLVGGAASAQEARGWLGVDVLDVTKAEADKLGWDVPHGAKLGVVASGSPAQKAGLRSGEIILSIDNVEPETSADFDKSIAAKRPGAEVKLRVLSGGRERRVAVTLAAGPAIGAAQDQDLPLLILDTGGHMALIENVAFSPDAKLLISAGQDKVVRVWDWKLGKTIRSIRGQVGPGPEGMLHAMTLSPDGRLLATAGWTDSYKATTPCCGDIRLYDFASGRLLALLKGHTSVVNGVAFSPDTTRLISGGHDNAAILWDVPGRKLLYRLEGHTAPLYAVAFTPDGQRVISGGDDNSLRMWRVSDGQLIAEMKGHARFIRRAIAVRSTDSMIASGDATGEIRLWDGRDGHFLRILGKQDSGVGVLRFSGDGKLLMSTSRDSSIAPQIVWDVASGTPLKQPKFHDNIVLGAAISPDGRLIATGGGTNNTIRVWELAAATPTMQTDGRPVVLAGTGQPGWATGFSPDGQRIAWGTTWQGVEGRHTHTSEASSPLQFELLLPAVNRRLGRPEKIDANAAATFVRASVTHGAYALAHRRGGDFDHEDGILDLKKDGKVIASITRGATDGYQHRAYTFTPDGQRFISAGDGGFITAYDLTGKPLGDYVGHEGDIWSLTTSADGRLLLSSGHDQTVRLWNAMTRELIATLFNGTDGEWVMWTPQGYYTGSPGADTIVGWQVNKGRDQVPDHVGADQLRQHLNRPDIVEKAIVLASAETAVRQAAGTTFRLADLLARPVPRFSIVAPQPGAMQQGGRASIRIAIASTPDPVKAIRVQVNGRQVDEVLPDVGSGGFGAGERMLDVPLASGENEVRITLTNAIGEKAETLTLSHKGDGDLDRRGTLYIIAIGVDKYPELGNSCGESGQASCNLRYAGADARALVEAVERRLGPTHKNVVKRVLVNSAFDPGDQPTAANILDAIGILKNATEVDSVLLFISGHGFNEGANYRFLPTNAAWDGTSLRGSTVVPWQILQEAVESAKGRRILFIDTCHSENAYNQRLGNAAYHANIIAYTAARFDQLALEDPGLGHGLFTYAVVEGLSGKGTQGSRQVSTKELADYVIKRVEQLAKAQNEEQEPQYFRGRDAEDYVLAHW